MEHLQLRIVQIRQETTNSKTFFVEEINRKKIDYKAGQFLTLIVTLNNKEVRRSYSISSTPGVDQELFFTIKRIENGELSRHLFDQLQVGDIIVSLPPTGRFTIEKPAGDLLVFITAGSGITPVFSLIKHVLYHFQETKVLLINQNHSEEDSIFRNELLHLRQHFPTTFFLEEIFSQPSDHGKRAQRLNNNLLETILLKWVTTQTVNFYLCGPAAFMRMAQFTLKVMKYSQHLIRQENFFAVAPPPPLMIDKKSHKVRILYANQKYDIDVAYPHNILEVALKHNIHLPYSCRGGRCSTCTARCTSGRIIMTINDVLTPQDIDDGLILTCVAYPETDVEITFSPKLEEENIQ